MDPLSSSIASLLASLERAGGYAALVGLVLIGVFVLARYAIQEQRKASDAREKESRLRNEEAMRRMDEALARERENAGEHQRRTDRVIDVVESNTKALTMLIVGQGQQEKVLLRINESLNAPGRKRAPTAERNTE